LQEHVASLDVDIQSFSAAIVASLEHTFGPPADFVAVPRLVLNIQGTLRQYIRQHPHWASTMQGTKHVATLKSRGQAAWGIVDVDRQLRVAPVTALCVDGAPAPSRRHYKLVTSAASTARLEPAYTAGETTPTDLLGAVAVDQFRQRHLAPPLNMTAEEVRQVLQWTPVPFPKLVVTSRKLKRVIQRARYTSPYRDLIEYCHVGMLSEEQFDLS